MLNSDLFSTIPSEFEDRPLRRQDLHADPFAQFHIWLQHALAASVERANAMVLATATPDGKPSARMVLLKGLEKGRFEFCGNGESRKGQELSTNPQAALLFFWPELGRQIRIEGSVEKLPAADAERTFTARPRESQIAALASSQSQPLINRHSLEDAAKHLTAQFADQPIPTPNTWAAYALTPHYFEFWQGRPNRLHDRFAYTRPHPPTSAEWGIQRLYP